MHDLVIEDVALRKMLGLARYGQPLQAGNGRDPWRDAYEELLDLCCYLRQVMQERELLVERVRAVMLAESDRLAGVGSADAVQQGVGVALAVPAVLDVVRGVSG